MTVELRFLLDEHISPTHVARFAEHGCLAVFVAHIGLAGLPDEEIFAYAIANSFIVVTKNARDFFQLAERIHPHPGLLVLRAGAQSVDVEWAFIETGLQRLLKGRLDPVNLAVEVTRVGHLEIREIPPAD